MAKTLSHLSREATQVQNRTGITDSILEIVPENGTRLKLHDQVPTGSSQGLALIMKLRDSDGNHLPTDTELILRVERPTDDEPTPVSVKESNIAAWNGMSTEQQRNEENIDSVKIRLNGSSVNVRDKDVLTVEINSSEQIDWSNSEFYVVREGVDELPYEG